MWPSDWAEGLEQRVAQNWDLAGPLPLPWPHMQACPFCAGGLVMKEWKFHDRTNTGSRTPFRCDVRMKCTGCSFGVAVPRDYYDRRPADGWIAWRSGKRILEKGRID
jgi:hypothetical protein